MPVSFIQIWIVIWRHPICGFLLTVNNQFDVDLAAGDIQTRQCEVTRAVTWINCASEGCAIG